MLLLLRSITDIYILSMRSVTTVLSLGITNYYEILEILYFYSSSPSRFMWKSSNTLFLIKSTTVLL